jgi:sRNA-binding regulator protein Hfq
MNTENSNDTDYFSEIIAGRQGCLRSQAYFRSRRYFMDTVWESGSGHDGIFAGAGMDQLVEAIRGLSGRLEGIQQTCGEESERLRKYKEAGALLEFTLVTGGVIRGTILWLGNQSVGIKADSGQDFILYKHAIAFIQE